MANVVVLLALSALATSTPHHRQPLFATKALTVDIKANGKHGPLHLKDGQSFTYTWKSKGAAACQVTSPIASNISTAGKGGPIKPGHAFYPAAGKPVTITIVCTDGTTNATDSVVITLGK